MPISLTMFLTMDRKSWSRLSIIKYKPAALSLSLFAMNKKKSKDKKKKAQHDCRAFIWIQSLSSLLLFIKHSVIIHDNRNIIMNKSNTNITTASTPSRPERLQNWNTRIAPRTNAMINRTPSRNALLLMIHLQEPLCNASKEDSH